MRTKAKKFTAVILMVIMLIIAIPVANFAGIDFSESAKILSIKANAETEEYFQEGIFTYTVKDEVATLVSCSEGGDIVIPSFLGGYPVTIIGKKAFMWGGLSSIYIPNTVTTIEESAFWGCSFTEITIPESVTSIAQNSFFWTTSLLNVFVDKNNPNYTNDDFGVLFDKTQSELILYPTGNTRDIYQIPNGVKKINFGAFYGCKSLTDISIPNTVTHLGSFSFYWCEGLTTIDLPDSIKEIGSDAFFGCTKLSEITIPKSVTSIGADAFENCTSLNKVTIQNGVTSIGARAFLGCTSLTSIDIPDSIIYVGYGAFENCTYLSNVSFGKGIKTISSRMFYGCTRLSTINIPNGITSIGDYAFAESEGLSYVTISESVSSIGKQIFYGCYMLKKISVNQNNSYYSSDEYGVLFNKDKTDLIYYPVGNSKTTNYTIPSSVLNIGSWSFHKGEYLRNITIPVGVVNIEMLAFGDCCNLSSITIPNSVITIGDSAFAGCTSLESVIIPNSVTSIGMWAFGDCGNLDFIHIPASVTHIGYDDVTGLISRYSSTYICSETENCYAKTYAENNGIKDIKFKLCNGHTESGNPNMPDIPSETPVDDDVIPSPSQTKINYGDSIILSINPAKLSVGTTVVWESNNDNFTLSPSTDGKSCVITSTKSGDAIITVKIVNSEGKIISTDKQAMTSNAGFFQKIISFFKNLFRMNRTIYQSIKTVF